MKKGRGQQLGLFHLVHLGLPQTHTILNSEYAGAAPLAAANRISFNCLCVSAFAQDYSGVPTKKLPDLSQQLGKKVWPACRAVGCIAVQSRGACHGHLLQCAGAPPVEAACNCGKAGPRHR